MWILLHHVVALIVTLSHYVKLLPKFDFGLKKLKRRLRHGKGAVCRVWSSGSIFFSMSAMSLGLLDVHAPIVQGIYVMRFACCFVRN